MKSLNPLKFFGTIVIVLSFVLVSQNSFAQKDSKVNKKDDKSFTSESNDQKVEFQRLSSHENPLMRASEGIKSAKVEIPSSLANDNKRHPEEGVYSHPKNTQSKELIEKRDAYTKHFDNQDGTNTQMKGENPIHYMKDGLWLTYDETVVSEGNLYSLKSTDHPIILNGQNSSGSFLLEAGKSLELLNNSQMYFYASDTENKLDASTSSISESNGFGSEIVFDNFYGGIDKKFTMKRGYLRYDYIVNNVLDVPNNADFLTFSDKFRLPKGWSVETGIGQQGDIGWKGSLNILDENGKNQLTIGLPFIYDSGDKTTSNSQEFGEYLWVQNGRDFELTLNVSTDWLTSASRVYPLIIDPTISESDLTSGSLAKSGYVVGCEKEMALDPGGMEVTGYYCTYNITAQNWGYMSEQVSRVNFNSSLAGSGNSEGTYSYTTPTYTDLNGFPVGPVSVIWSGYRTYGGSACDTYYQVRTNWYTYLTTSAPPCSGTPSAGTATFSSVSTCSGTTITTTMTGTDDGIGITYQWFGNGAPLIGQNSAALSHIPVSTTDYFLEVTCTNSGGQAITDPQIVEVNTCYNCPTSGNTSQLTCGASIYDNGGQGGSGTDDDTGNYSDGVDGSITIYPDTPGSMVSISGSIDTESGYDVFYVYDGTSTSAAELTGGLSGTGGGLSYTATNIDGALTIRLDTDGSVNRGGFDFTVSCVSTCTGTPATGTSTASAADNCSGTATTVAVSGTEVNGGISYDWESSADGSTGWASIGGVYQASISQSPTSTTYYRHKTTCSNSGVSSYSNVVSKTVETITAGSGGSSCGTGTIDLTASTNSGTVEWYSASSGGSAVSTGNTYSVSMSSSTTYFAASSGCTGTRVAVAGTINDSPTTDAGSAVAHCNGSSSVLSGSASMSPGSIPSSYGDCYATSWADTYISNVTFNSISTSSGTNALNVETNNTGTIITVVAGSSYTLSITTNDASGTAYTHGIAAFIDWNRDGDFEDADETVYTTTAEVAIGTYTTTVNVPSGASEGDMMLRVVANEATGTPSSTGVYTYGETEKFTVRIDPTFTYLWSPTSDLNNSAIAGPTTSTTSTRTYTLTATAGNGCTSSDDVVASVYENPVSGTISVDSDNILNNSQILTWTGSGSANGNYILSYVWTDSTETSPSGLWTSWGSDNPKTWSTGSAGSNVNKKLWVKSTITSANGCGSVETTPVSTIVTNCSASASSASVTAGTVSNMPYGETITWDANYYGNFDSWEYQWSSNPGVWNTNWSSNDPHSWTAVGQPANQTLSVRGKITGASVSGSPTCTRYSDAIETFIIDCASTVSADAGSDDALCNGSSVVLSGSGSGNSAVTGYSWSPDTELSSNSIAGPTATTTSTRTYTLTTTHANGCTATDDVIITTEDAPTVTSSSTVTDVSTCGINAISVSVSANAGEGAWSNTGIGSFDATTDASTTFQSNTYNSPMTLTWTHSNGECSGTQVDITAQFNQPVTTSFNAYTFDTECWIWGGLTNSEWSTAANWYKYDGSKWLRQSSSTPGASDKVYLMSYANAGSLCVSNSNNAIIPAAAVTDLIVGSGAEVDLNGSFSLAGDLTNNGTINYGTSSVSMTGGSDQTISGSATTLNNLTVNKTGGSLIVITPITVMGTLDMSAGNIINSSIVILGSSSANPGILSHTTGIITGEFRRYFPNATGSQLFPIGTASVMRDVSVNFTSAPGSNQYLTASYVTGAPTLFGGGAYEGLPLMAADGQLITNYDNEGHWVINPTNDDYTSTINGKAYTISLHMNGIADATDYSKTRIIKSAGSNTASQHHLSWEALTNQSVSGYNGANPSNSNFAVTATSTGFSVFGGGSDNGDPLPVELVSFNGSCNDGLVELIWETASEYNSSHFDVENSRDGIIWDVVKTIEAAGISNEMLTYKYTDVNAHGGNNYYRLTQVDIDGTSKTYDIINVSCSQTTAGYFSIFPNPSSGSFQVILNNTDIIGDAEMNVVDTKGNVVLMKSIDVKSGINMYVVDEELAPGIYYISVINGDKTTIVLKHSVK